MAKRILDNDEGQRRKNTGEIIDHLIHEMENDLQVISLQAHLQLRSERETRCALDAAENIGRLLGKMRRYFLLPR